MKSEQPLPSAEAARTQTIFNKKVTPYIAKKLRAAIKAGAFAVDIDLEKDPDHEYDPYLLSYFHALGYSATYGGNILRLNWKTQEK